MIGRSRFTSGRRRFAAAVAAVLAVMGLTAGSASAITSTFSNSSVITIPDSGTATPYPSTINVSGFAGNVQKVTATLHNLHHTDLNDIAVLLVGPSGTNSLLMGRVGGSDDAGIITLTFDQSSPFALNPDNTAVSGTFRPSQESTKVEPLDPPAPAGPTYPADLDLFNGTPANGEWKLFIQDEAAVDEGLVGGGWSLDVTAAVNTLTTGKPKLNKKKGIALIPVTVGDAGQLNLSGKGVKSASASKAVAVGGPGTVNLKVKPKGKTSKKLNSTGKAKVKVKITFTPNGGTPNVQTKKIKLKKTLKQ
jgi:subtilisin-like proprotein convertase family protein